MIVVRDFDALRRALDGMTKALSEPADRLFDSRLVARELLTNALRYGGGEAYFSFERVEGGVRISVRSANDFRPPEKVLPASAEAEGGRGLYLVDALSSARRYSEEEGIVVIVPIG